MRADQYLVHHGYFESRSKAVAAIKAGNVSINGKRIKKPSELIVDGTTVAAEPAHPWVSRGGLKLVGALDAFGVDPVGKMALDVGASTGGFTDVLLSRGAHKVYAVDVGRDQLHAKLLAESRVVNMEQTDARTLRADMFDPLPTLIVCDASFISARKVLLAPMSIVSMGSELISLVKPQFEVGRDNVGKGGIVRSKAAAQAALEDISRWCETQGWTVLDAIVSPIKGGDGNTEYLLHARKA